MNRTLTALIRLSTASHRRRRGPYVERTTAAGFAIVARVVGRSQDRPPADADELCRGGAAHHAPRGGSPGRSPELPIMQRPWWSRLRAYAAQAVDAYGRIVTVCR